MSWKDRCVSFLRKYGTAAKAAACGVLAFIPGGAAMVPIVDKALEAAQQISENLSHEQWEQEMRARLGGMETQVERLADTFEMLLTGPLAELCERTAEADGSGLLRSTRMARA
ncbi:MAG: hypothetical protein ACFCD0_17215 [Gemmataceae bacterium]